MSIAQLQVPDEQRFVLSSIDWPTYLAFSDRLGERHVRVTYDRGEMELMTLSPEHERAKHLLGLLVVIVAEEMDIDIGGFGSMTCRREELARGFEPDECYWIANEPQVRGRNEIDLDTDPPPDLVLEIEISRSFLDRLDICAHLGVPEVWCWNGERLRILMLGSDGQYTESERSRAFLFLPMAELTRFLQMSATLSETKLLRAFRAWVREQMAQGWTGPGGASA